MTSVKPMRARFAVLAVATIALLAVAVPATPASASLIYQAYGWEITVPDWSGPQSGAAVVIDSAQNGVLVIQIFKIFQGGLDEFGNMPVINMHFRQYLPDNQTAAKIVINDEAVTNLTDMAWTDFHWKLVSGPGNPVAFNRQQTFPSEFNLTGQDFYIAPFTNHSWQSGPGTEELTVFGGGVVPIGSQFTPGDLQGNLVLDINLSGASPINFDLKEAPSVPEPATLALLGLGGLALAGRRRRRAA